MMLLINCECFVSVTLVMSVNWCPVLDLTRVCLFKSLRFKRMKRLNRAYLRFSYICGWKTKDGHSVTVSETCTKEKICLEGNRVLIIKIRIQIRVCNCIHVWTTQISIVISKYSLWTKIKLFLKKGKQNTVKRRCYWGGQRDYCLRTAGGKHEAVEKIR